MAAEPAAEPVAPAEPIEVRLPVCGVCGRAGKIAWSKGGRDGKWACEGDRDDRHKRRIMQWRIFREVIEDAPA